jgi:cyclophilin family peptidyl-prolyl cis-trans isomerase
MRRFANMMMILVTCASAARAIAAPAKPAPGAVKAALELNQQFYYMGEPLNVRVTIANNGSAELSNPVKSPILGSFVVADNSGTRLEMQGKPETQEPTRPSKLASKAFYGAVVDLSQIYPQLKSKGRYTIRWSADGVESDKVLVTVIPKFDPSKNYSARVETEEGAFVVDLMKLTAPIATKAFVDLANAGFYDGLLFHDVRRDQAVSGGDPTGTGGGQAPLRYPAELAAVPVVAGTVVLKPAGLAPPANSSQFIIALRPEPSWTGQFTVLGQVTDGLEVVRKISSVPSTDRPNYRPIKDIHTIRVTVLEK